MTYEAFKRELFQTVLRQAKAGGSLAKLVEKGSFCQDVQLISAIQMAELRPGCREPEYSAGRKSSAKQGVCVKEDLLVVIPKEQGGTEVLCRQVRRLYERYRHEGWQSVLPEIVMKLQREPKENWRDTGSNSYQSNRDSLIVRMLNLTANREELENCVYWQFGDMAMVLYAVIYDMEPDLMSMKITRGMLEEWHVSDKEALTNALLNTYAKMPPRLCLNTDIRGRCGWTEGMFSAKELFCADIHPEDGEEGMRGYRLTTTRLLNGAVAFFYPGVKEQLADIFQGDYYVGFTNIHEAVLHPVRHKVLGEMKAAIQHANAVFDQREVLTNRVYRYCTVKEALVEV